MSFENVAVGHAIGYPGYQAANVQLGSVVLNGPSNFILGTPGVSDPVFGQFNLFNTPQGEIVDFYANRIGTAGEVALLPGNASGGFSLPVTTIFMNTTTSPESPIAFIFSQLDKSNPFPTLVAVTLNGDLKWRHATGARTYGPLNVVKISPTGIASEDIVAGQFNPAVDNHIDVAVTVVGVTPAFNQVAIFLGDGNGNLSAGTTLPVGIAPFGLARGDLNGDRIDDLVVAINGVGVISAFLGDGNGFQFVNDFPVGANPRFVKLGKVNNDNFLDAVAGNNDGTVSVLLGIGNGNFSPQTRYTVSTSILSVDIGDFRNIGVVDIVTANNVAGDLVFLLNNGSGRFPTQIHAPVNATFTPFFTAPSGVTVAKRTNGEILIGAIAQGTSSAAIYTIAAPTPSPSPSPSMSTTLTPSTSTFNPSSSQSATISLSSAAVAASSEAARKPDNPDPKPDATKKPQPTQKETRKPTKTKKASASRSRPQSEVSAASPSHMLRDVEYLPSSLMLLAAGAKIFSHARATVSQWASSFFQEKQPMQADEPIITSHQKMQEVFEMPPSIFPQASEIVDRPQACAELRDEGFCVLDTHAFDHAQQPFFTPATTPILFLFAHGREDDHHHRDTVDAQAQQKVGVRK